LIETSIWQVWRSQKFFIQTCLNKYVIQVSGKEFGIKFEKIVKIFKFAPTINDFSNIHINLDEKMGL
jgi:hypothetical protein